MMNKKTLFTNITLAAWYALGAPCHAQPSPVEMPVLDQYVGYCRMYFARVHEGAVAFYGGINTRDLSNVWVAATCGPQWPKREIKAQTEIWADRNGRPHSLSVLRLQIKFNDDIKARAYNRWTHKWDEHEPFVAETGILDRATLAIPHTKLLGRAHRISSQIERKEFTNFTTYVNDTLKEAFVRLSELEQAMQSVPVLKTQDMPSMRDRDHGLDGLRGLSVDLSFDLTPMTPDSSRNDRYQSAKGEVPPERSVAEFIDLSGLTQTVVADLQQKEIAAVKAVDFAQSLCNDLLNSACQ